MDGQQFEMLQGVLTDIKAEQKKNRETLEIIERAVLGEERAGHRGLVKRMDLMETWKTNLDIRMATYSGFAVCLGFLFRYLIKGSI